MSQTGGCVTWPEPGHMVNRESWQRVSGQRAGLRHQVKPRGCEQAQAASFTKWRAVRFIQLTEGGKMTRQYTKGANLWVSVLVAALTSATVLADPLKVPDKYTTIQEAIDACLPGGEVIVADGTYTGTGNKDLEFGGKAITVRSENGPDNCIIDCQASGRGFCFVSSEAETSIVDGFTITNGYADNGGAIKCVNSDPTIIHCTITANAASVNGGGIYCEMSNPTIDDCTITGNHATEGGILDFGFGGGICCVESDPTITNCTINANFAEEGGAIQCYLSSPTITDCDMSWNTTTDACGGVHCEEYSQPVISDCTILENTSGDYGGGVAFTDFSDGTIVSCTISGNSTPMIGGGIHCRESNPLIVDCVIATNNAGSYGGGIICNSAGPTVVACTIADNSSGTVGGGIACLDLSNATVVSCRITENVSTYDGGAIYSSNSAPTFNNCTISKNRAAVWSAAVFCDGGNTTLTNCILWGDTPQEISIASGDVLAAYCDIAGGWTGNGNVDDDPLFADPNGPDGDPNTWEDNDYRLTIDSTCVDAGDPNFVAASGETDREGCARVWDGDGNGTPVVDMGAYEFGSHSYGDLNCDGWVNNGDIDAFVFALSYPEQYPAEYPDCDIMLGDINGDGWMNNGDIDAFVALLWSR